MKNIRNEPHEHHQHSRLYIGWLFGWWSCWWRSSKKGSPVGELSSSRIGEEASCRRQQELNELIMYLLGGECERKRNSCIYEWIHGYIGILMLLCYTLLPFILFTFHVIYVKLKTRLDWSIFHHIPILSDNPSSLKNRKLLYPAIYTDISVLLYPCLASHTYNTLADSIQIQESRRVSEEG